MKYTIITSVKLVFLTCLFLLFAPTALLAAELELPALFSDGMILQRDKEVPVWGWSEAGAKVRVIFGEQELETLADGEGRWEVRLQAMPASSEEQSLIIRCGEQVKTISGVLIGEVWLCSGQSNMAWTMANSAGLPELSAQATNSAIRRFAVRHLPSLYPVTELHGSWTPSSPAAVAGFSAVAYCFGKELADKLEIPIGLITSSVGGTAIEPWTPPEGFASVEELSELNTKLDAWLATGNTGKQRQLEYYDGLETWLATARKFVLSGRMPAAPPTSPGWAANLVRRETALYNGMIHPLIPYAIRGAIWYQGENNGGQGLEYYPRMKALIRGWRSVWQSSDLSFYYVQLPGFRNSDPHKPADGSGWAFIREAQANALSEPMTGMACILDLGEANNIHPGNKLDVGKRLARLALAGTYGRDVVYSGPLFREAVAENEKMRIHFDHCHGGLMAAEKQGFSDPQKVAADSIRWFALAGQDKVWHPASVSIDGETVVLQTPAVTSPVAVRYAFTANPEGALLYNRAGLPAFPFRSDDW